MKTEQIRGVERKVGELIGEASMCWSELPSGVFETSRAKRIVDDILKLLNSRSLEDIPACGVSAWMNYGIKYKYADFWYGKHTEGLKKELIETGEGLRKEIHPRDSEDFQNDKNIHNEAIDTFIKLIKEK